MSNANNTETFLVVLSDSSNGGIQAFLWQGTWEDVYKLNHDQWSLSIFLLAPEEPQLWNQWGTQLLRVCDLKSTHKALELARASAFELSRLAPSQAVAEYKLIQEVYKTGSANALEKVYADTREGNLERLRDLGIVPLTDEQIQELRREH